MSEKFLKHTEGQYMRSTSVSLWKDVYSHKVHKHISSRCVRCLHMCGHTHSPRSKSWLQEQNISFKYSEPSPVSQSPPIQFEPWGQVSYKYPTRWEGIILMCSVRLSGGTWGFQSPSMAHLGAQTKHCTGDPAGPSFFLLLSTRVEFRTFSPLWEKECSLAMFPSLQHLE